jgi:hypothetical protein
MKKEPQWLRKLNKADRDHLKEGLERVTLRRFRAAIASQHRYGFPCHTCTRIARKLGIEKEA